MGVNLTAIEVKAKVINYKLSFMRILFFLYIKFNVIFWILPTKRFVCVASFEYLKKMGENVGGLWSHFRFRSRCHISCLLRTDK